MIKTFRNLCDLLDRREKRNGALLLAIMLVQGFVEMAGVASIVPFMTVVANPKVIHSNSYLAAIYDGLGFNSQTSFLLFLGIGSLLVILARIGVTGLTTYATMRYAQMRSFALSIRLLENYIMQPYEWFLNRHSAGMVKAVLSEVDEVVKDSLMPAFALVSQLIIVTCLIILVVIAEPRVALLTLLIVGTVYGLIYWTLRNYLRELGRGRLTANRQRFQIANELLGGIKEVKIRGLERPYLRRFTNSALQFARRKARYAVVNQMPRHCLEALGMASIMGVVLLFLVSAGGDLSTVLPLLALYAFAGLRLLPAVQKVYANLVSLRFGSSALDAVHADLMQAHNAVISRRREKRLPLNSYIKLSNISYTYPKADRPSLVDISLKIEAKSTIGFVGSTGAGKTTLVDIIIGLLSPQQGQIEVDGKRLSTENIREWQQSIGYVPQQTFLSDDTIACNIAFGVPQDKIDREAVERASRSADLHTFIASELAQGYDTKVGERGVRLSGGQRQRIGIARALYHDPDVLVFDEATSALDNVTERIVMTAIRNLAHTKTILIIAHRLTTVRACDRLYLLDHGRLKAAGTYDDLVERDETFYQMANSHLPA